MRYLSKHPTAHQNPSHLLPLWLERRTVQLKYRPAEAQDQDPAITFITLPFPSGRLSSGAISHLDVHPNCQHRITVFHGYYYSLILEIFRSPSTDLCIDTTDHQPQNAKRTNCNSSSAPPSLSAEARFLIKESTRHR